jgi:hypothetical protein
MKRLLLFLLYSLSLGCAQSATSDELATVKDSALVHLLNNVEIVQERRDLPVAVRVFRLRELGECDGPAPNCPREVLYVAVSTFDEAPDQVLFTLPEAYGWTFVRWVSWPGSDDASEYASFEVRGRVLVADGTVAERNFVVRVNKVSGTINAIDPQ